MKVTFSILYKNGAEDIIDQEGKEAEIDNVLGVVKECLEGDVNGIITFGDGVTKGKFIRVSDITRVGIEVK